jgi:hypothetical protein
MSEEEPTWYERLKNHCRSCGQYDALRLTEYNEEKHFSIKTCRFCGYTKTTKHPYVVFINGIMQKYEGFDAERVLKNSIATARCCGIDPSLLVSSLPEEAQLLAGKVGAQQSLLPDAN